MKCVLIFSLLISFNLFSQRISNDTLVYGKVLFGVQYGTGWPAGDLVNRFGFMNTIGLNAGYKFKSQWQTGVDANFLFGDKIKLSNLFDGLIDSYGNITDINGSVANVHVVARGVSVNAVVGRLVPLTKKDLNSGLLFQFGIGYMNHRIKIETQDQVVPPLELEYKKGYDRLTTGLNTSQFIGYSYMSKGGYFNFYSGIYAMQGCTFNRRTLFFDQPEVPVPTEMRLDLLFGIRFGWYIPFYSNQTEHYIEY